MWKEELKPGMVTAFLLNRSSRKTRAEHMMKMRTLLQKKASTSHVVMSALYVLETDKKTAQGLLPYAVWFSK